jgi:chromate transporter
VAPAEPRAITATAPGTWPEVLAVFLRLGLTSFGGPVAHIGYFREEFVNRRHWLDDRSYADLVVLCQFFVNVADAAGAGGHFERSRGCGACGTVARMGTR